MIGVLVSIVFVLAVFGLFAILRSGQITEQEKDYD